MVVQRFQRDETLMRLGEAATFFGIVLQGTVAVRQGDTVAALKYPGDLLGELALFNGGLRSADLVPRLDREYSHTYIHAHGVPIRAHKRVVRTANARVIRAPGDDFG